MKTASVPLQNHLMGNQYALRFNGTTGKVTAPSVAVGVRFTVEGWIKRTNFTGQRSFFSNRGGAGQCYAGVTTKPFLFMNNATPASFTGNTTLTAGALYHLAFTNDGVTTNSYLNGVLDRSAAQANPGSTGTVGIGWDPSIATEFWDGDIDEVRLYSRACSAQEIAEHAAGVFKDETGLVRLWPFDEGSGLTAYDWSGNASDGTLAGGVVYVPGQAPDDAREFRRADLWTFTLANGYVARFTTLDQDVKVGGGTWFANGPVLTRPTSRLVAGVEVGEFQVTVEPRATDLIGGLPWPQAARLGLMRHGRLLIERVYFPAWGNVSLGKLHMMSGRMAGINGDGGAVRISVKSDLELLNIMYPLNVVQPSCRWTLFDAGCKLSSAAFQVAGAVSGGSTVSSVLATLGQADGHFSLGRIVFDAFASLPGSAGNFVSTPDSAAASVTGDIDIRVRARAPDWTPAAGYDFLSKSLSGAGDGGYELQLLSSGLLRLVWSTGVAVVLKDSTVAPTVSDGAAICLRATLDVDNLAGGNDVRFYTSPDGMVWTQLGATVTTAGVTSIGDNASALCLGARVGGTSLFSAVDIYTAEIRNGIDGPVVAKFDPTRDTLPTATTVLSSTGELWTVNQSGGSPATLKVPSNRGYSRSIKKHTAGTPATLALVNPLPAVPATGDQFIVYPGCDKLQPTCTNKFSNLANFGGEPYVPRPETAA